MEEAYAVLGRLSGGAGLRFSVDYCRREQAMLYAELPEALASAAVDGLVISHAGLNTTLTALGCGVPVLAIPITNEQPCIAARLLACGAGRVMPVQRLQAANQAAGGVATAADLVERATRPREGSCC